MKNELLSTTMNEEKLNDGDQQIWRSTQAEVYSSFYYNISLIPFIRLVEINISNLNCIVNRLNEINDYFFFFLFKLIFFSFAPPPPSPSFQNPGNATGYRIYMQVRSSRIGKICPRVIQNCAILLHNIYNNRRTRFSLLRIENQKHYKRNECSYKCFVVVYVTK